jgi:hypothetical protein
MLPLRLCCPGRPNPPPITPPPKPCLCAPADGTNITREYTVFTFLPWWWSTFPHNIRTQRPEHAICQNCQVAVINLYRYIQFNRSGYCGILTASIRNSIKRFAFIMTIMTGITLLSPEIWHCKLVLVTYVSAFNSASTLRVEGVVFSSAALQNITQNNNLKKNSLRKGKMQIGCIWFRIRANASRLGESGLDTGQCELF